MTTPRDDASAVPPQADAPRDAASTARPAPPVPTDTDATGDAASPVPPEADPPGDAASGRDAAVPVPVEKPRSRSATAVIALLVMLLGFALVVQVRSRGDDAGLSSARPEDLVRILSDLDAQQTRLRDEISDLDNTERRLSSGAQSQDTALAEARRRADALGVLAGTLPAVGPGLVVVFTPGTDPLAAATLLDAVEELRGAGAEAMQIDSVRVVASTSFVDSAGGITTGDVLLRPPCVLTVIGDPQTMLTALNIPGGVVDSVRQHGGTVSVREADQVAVTALHTATGLAYARPVS
jgi:uncharacterized protein YlxW (UPF0749 family)